MAKTSHVWHQILNIQKVRQKNWFCRQLLHKSTKTWAKSWFSNFSSKNIKFLTFTDKNIKTWLFFQKNWRHKINIDLQSTDSVNWHSKSFTVSTPKAFKNIQKLIQNEVKNGYRFTEHRQCKLTFKKVIKILIKIVVKSWTDA